MPSPNLIDDEPISNHKDQEDDNYSEVLKQILLAETSLIGYNNINRGS